jgi:pre-mRNA-splicing factor SYF1
MERDLFHQILKSKSFMEQLESDVINNPYRLKSWITYVSYLDNFDPYQKFKVYERALKYLPRSYKLWFSYLNERERDLRGYTINDKGYDILIETYERSLVNMHKMPKIW